MTDDRHCYVASCKLWFLVVHSLLLYSDAADCQTGHPASENTLPQSGEFSLKTGGLVRPCNSFACVTVELLLLGRIAVLCT